MQIVLSHVSRGVHEEECSGQVKTDTQLSRFLQFLEFKIHWAHVVQI